MRRSIAAGILISLIANSSTADVLMKPLKNGREYISIEGKIKAEDPQKLNALLKRWAGAISLNSEGGDVDAAMQLGRILRGESRDVVIAEDAICASACVFILAGAPTRIVFGSVAIHRPFLADDTETDSSNQKTRYKIIGTAIRQYLDEMNVSPSLYEDMIRVPPSRARVLSKIELENYGLSGTDPYIDEANTSEMARNLNISKAEYISRQQEKDAKCIKYLNSDPQLYGKCATAVEYGVSLEEYKRREKSAETVCGKEPAMNAPGRVKWVRCQDNVLRGL